MCLAAGRGVGRRQEKRAEEEKEQEEEEPERDGGGMGTVDPGWGNQSNIIDDEDEQ